MKNRTLVKLSAIVGSLCMNLGVSAQQSTSENLSKKLKNEVIESLISNLNDNYVFPEVAAKIASDLKSKQKSGVYSKISDPKEFAKILTDDLRNISHDKHLGVRFYGDMMPDVNDAEVEKRQQEIQQHVMKVANYGFRKVEILQGNVGYLKIDGFAPADLGATGANASMAFLANTDAMIIDLRENHGGEPEMVLFLASYFFKSDVHLNDLYYRKANRTDSFRTKDPSGARYEKPVYILTSSRTFSGGEEFAYDFQTQKRATLIGETTGGGANPGDEMMLKGRFSAFIPTGRAINPVTKTNWEGIGVIPDVKMAAEDALQHAHETALKSLLAMAPETYKDYFQRALDRVLKQRRN
ncbi:S41 family peptidase [Flavobacterium sp.]|uniref:S41 family peptidase n=1 Tax=Flavobacterium sp. TaxID=239 RepID=UPI001212D69A|nr:S41 family peptidase [Flavobacterium sp.]RZJ73862.1 MAG: hypothetical protein EOO49_00460 [Flavobacterium sp.]